MAAKPSVVIVGAGMAGCSTAYFLTTQPGFTNVTVIDPFTPGSVTSSKSTECYRNWWPEKQMLAFVNHSIALLEEIADKSANSIEMIRGGYAFATAEQARVEKYHQEGVHCSSIGMGAYRRHDGEDPTRSGYLPSPSTSFNKTLEGLDVITNAKAAKALYPFLGDSTIGLKHVRKCGWFTVARYLDFVTAAAKKAGAKFVTGEVCSVSAPNDSNGPAVVTLKDGSTLQADYVVVCVGPKSKNLSALFNDPTLVLPITNEIHAKVVFDDTKKVIPRDAPLVLFDDNVSIPWTKDQTDFLSNDPSLAWMTKQIPGGVHFRPLGGVNSTELVGIWTYNVDTEDTVDPPFHPAIDDYYGEIVIQGLATFVPGLKQYIGTSKDPKSSSNPFVKAVQVGHYCKTPENRPLIGSLSTTPNTTRSRVVLVGALSGFGIMSSPAAGELAAKYCAGATLDSLPSYAQAFRVERYQNPDYVKQIDEMKKLSGQL